uniref:Alcohol dehydrogenase superfamily protein n=1 Tax=Mycena chlorophos TaxID=658473 RepID=A0ABQ0M1E8_MYCCL|nr:alcohol dehydrogenase superfamily protein [Mycena chlorophos]
MLAYAVPQTGFDNLALVEVPLPTLKANEVLVKIKAVSLQFRDLMVTSGTYPPPYAPQPTWSLGEIVAIGEDVKTWKVGARVVSNFFLDHLDAEGMTSEIAKTALGGASHGVLAEYRALPAHSLLEIPAHLSYEEASTLPCAALTAYNGLIYGFEPLKAGDTVLIQGTGGVSIFALQFAVASGATTIVLSSSDEKLAAATKLGAKHVINYNTTPEWAKEAKKLTNGRGVDRVVEVVGNATLARSFEAARMGGSVDIIGLLGEGPEAPAVSIIGPAIGKQLKIRGIYVGSVSQFQAMNRLLAANPETTRPVIDKVFPFAEAKDAFGYLKSQKHVGKVVIRV